MRGQRAQTRLLHGSIHAFLIPVCVVAMIPLLLIVMASITDEKTLALNGYQLWPAKFSGYAYEFLWKQPEQLLYSYGVSIFVTVVGSALSLLIMSMLAYAISRRDFALRGIISFYVFFTMLFSGGLVPYYILMTRTLHLKNSLLALILPYLVMPFFVLLLRTYFASLPRDLIDAAKVDGASEWRIFFRIVVPLSTPALATVGLFSVLLYWNDLWQALLFIDSQRMYPCSTCSTSSFTMCRCCRSWPWRRARRCRTSRCAWPWRSSQLVRCCLRSCSFKNTSSAALRWAV